ncbi:MAG TPA: MFS transporter [Mycobacteriales bacterium]|nr:MFS transporter [Mycobacteriales bacterium]
MTLLAERPADAPARSPLRHRVRGRVLFLLCLLYAVSYVDRTAISSAGPALRADLHLSETQFGLALAAYSLPYALLQVFGGWIGDRFGPRKVLGVLAVLWGISTLWTGLATGLLALGAARLLLGLSEGAAFPTATRAMATWLPGDRRGYGQGVVHSAARVGAAVAPLVMAGLIATVGWRWGFIALGVLSALWSIVWLRRFKDRPQDDERVTDIELDELDVSHADAAPGTASVAPSRQVPWRRLVARLAPVTLVDFCYGWMLWVYLTWLPSFFQDEYGLALAGFALFTSLVLSAGVVSDTLGGMLSDKLLDRTRSLRTARRANLIIGLAGSMLALIPSLLVHDLVLVTISLTVSFFFLELTNSVLWTIPMDIAPQHAGVASGLMNTGFGVAGIVSPIVFGFLIDRTGNWQLPFALSVVLLAVGTLLSLRVDPRPLEIEEPAVAAAA